MSVIYQTNAKDARMVAVENTIGLSGKLKLYTAGKALQLATFTFSASDVGAVSSGILTFNDANAGDPGILNTTASATGVAAVAEITTAGDVLVIDGLTVGTAATDLILDNTNITNGQNITINSASITHA